MELSLTAENILFYPIRLRGGHQSFNEMVSEILYFGIAITRLWITGRYAALDEKKQVTNVYFGGKHV